MGTSFGGIRTPTLFDKCVLYAPLRHCAGVSGDIDEFPILPSGVTITNTGTFGKSDLGNNKGLIAFTGSNYISLSDSTAWDIINSNFTFGGWFKFTTVANQSELFYQAADTDNFWLFDPWIVSGYAYTTAKVGGTRVLSYEWAWTPVANTWYHITLVKSDTTTWTLYLDGSTLTVTVLTAFDNTTVNIAGALQIGNGSYMNVGDLVIWKDLVLTQSEIKMLMSLTHPITGRGIMPVNGEYWRLS